MSAAKPCFCSCHACKAGRRNSRKAKRKVRSIIRASRRKANMMLMRISFDIALPDRALVGYTD
jgi:hypothetical protein